AAGHRRRRPGLRDEVRRLRAHRRPGRLRRMEAAPARDRVGLAPRARTRQARAAGGVRAGHEDPHRFDLRPAALKAEPPRAAQSGASKLILTASALRTAGPWYTASMLLPSGSSTKAA